MKKLMFAGQTFQAERIVKTNDSIIGYNDETVVFKFSGVSDFSGFRLAEGQEFDVPEPTAQEQLGTLGMQLAMEKIMNMQNNARKDEIINNLGAQVTQMKFEIMQLKGGDI